MKGNAAVVYSSTRSTPANTSGMGIARAAAWTSGMGRHKPASSSPTTVDPWTMLSIWLHASAANPEGPHNVRVPALPLSSRLGKPMVLLGAVLVIGGCGLGPPEQFPTGEVRGVVVEAGRPVEGGWIEFIPVDGTVGNLRSAPIEAKGSFRADRVSVGLNSVRLVNAPIRLPQGNRLFGSYGSPLRRVIPAEPSGPLQIDLVDEALRYQARQPTRPRYEFEPESRSGEEGSR